jgi:hypothetical protein
MGPASSFKSRRTSVHVAGLRGGQAGVKRGVVLMFGKPNRCGIVWSGVWIVSVRPVAYQARRPFRLGPAACGALACSRMALLEVLTCLDDLIEQWCAMPHQGMCHECTEKPTPGGPG